MIVNPDKGIFFFATAVMCSVSLYAAELWTVEPDPMRRLFVGEPNRLTLPPSSHVTDTTAGSDCPSTALVAPPAEETASEKGTASARDNDCDRGPVADAIPIPGGLSAASAKAEIPAPPISLGSTDRTH